LANGFPNSVARGAILTPSMPIYTPTSTANVYPQEVAKPFLKWAGGKGSLLPILRQYVPQDYKSYIEPFLGGAAMFFDLGPSIAILSDANSELINCYKAVRDNPKELLRELADCEISEVEFYRIRGLEPGKLTPLRQAARMIYLNKTCFNGLYRVNRKGQFNTPFGHAKNPRLADEDNILNVSERLKKVELDTASYDAILLANAKAGDFVYLDPPYLPVSAYSDFNRYTKGQFGEADHINLAKMFRELDKRGCYLLLSNSYHPKVHALYRGFRIKTVSAPRFINCKGGSRGDIKELLVTNFSK
jgi:DNA adenine methylase